MTLVLNHQQPLSGNKIWIAALLALSVASCTTKKTILSSSNQKVEEPTVVVTPKNAAETAAKNSLEKHLLNNTISLVLPFQLNRIPGTRVSEEDVKRSALALDYYQGFEIGVQEVAATTRPFKLKILDSEDDQAKNQQLAANKSVNESILIVGPVYPKEIRAFSAGLTNRNILQVSPLAASKATEFNNPNLVSITPSIQTHMEAMAKYVAKKFTPGDRIIIFETPDTDAKQYLATFQSELLGYNKSATVEVVQSLDALGEAMSLIGNNLIVCGSTSSFQIKTFMNKLEAQMEDYPYEISVFGHPNWSKISFDGYSHINNFKVTVSTSYTVDEESDLARKFTFAYRKKFTISPTEYAFKGYDAGRYFAQLIAEYGADYTKHVLKRDFQGLHNSFHFQYNPQYGYVNKAVGFMTFENGSFKLN
ncbi:amino acid ABC transporter substrate-binding protein [Sphingobacteriaceae bacterium WQ 2009]|uniref:Amino acid ABC transporter substrate-binding protein n=1 Tax=Rhinopithecimicrobium faecis TaxID=2820698 RepID=A0A8T4HB22_9SPHI|nr:amino acid ABC transporter substrate-binding protein [Sphingobacteriaceae bacterium WQ 2009]